MNVNPHDSPARRRAALVVLVNLLAAWPLAANDGFKNGDVFAGLADGKTAVYTGGRLRRNLVRPGGGQQTGMCFDRDGNLYTTDFFGSKMAKFDKNGKLVARDWGGPFSKNPESCVVDGQSNVYTSEVHGENRIRKFDSNGRVLDSYRPKVEDKGIDWIDLAADQCTMFYTSEGRRVMRYDVCRKKQLADFASNLRGPCYAIRVRENGEVMVACTNQVYRLAPAGTVNRTYPIADEILFAMNLDPDGAHFWTGGIHSGNVYRVDIESGQGTSRPLFNAKGKSRRRGSGNGGLWDALRQIGDLLDDAAMAGLAVYGERTAAIQAVRREEEKRQAAQHAEKERLAAERRAEEERLAAARRAEEERLAAARRAEKERLAAERRAEEERLEAQRRAEEERLEAQRRAEEERLAAERRAEEERRRQEKEERRRREEERRLRLGPVTFGPAKAVDLGRVDANSTGLGQLDLTGTAVDGVGEMRLTTTLLGSGMTLEIETEDGWMPIGDAPLPVILEEAEPRAWALRLRTGRCPTAVEEGASHHLHIIAKKGPGSKPPGLPVSLSAVVIESSWLDCWWPALAGSLGLALLAFVVHGFVSPSRFGGQAGVVLSPEEDMSEGYFHAIRAQQGSGSGFYRDARVYVMPDFRVVGKASGALACLRAEGQQIRMKPVAGTVWRQTADGEWERLPADETPMRLGTLYRDDSENVFFELRNA